MFILHANKTQLTVRQRKPATSEARFEFSPGWDGTGKLKDEMGRTL